MRDGKKVQREERELHLKVFTSQVLFIHQGSCARQELPDVTCTVLVRQYVPRRQMYLPGPCNFAPGTWLLAAWGFELGQQQRWPMGSEPDADQPHRV